MKDWYLYIARCSSGALYTGIALNPEERIRKHNRGKGSKAVKALGLPVVLEYQTLMGTKSKALQAEAFIKSLSKERKEKFLLITSVDWGQSWEKE